MTKTPNLPASARRSNSYVKSLARGLSVICAFGAETPEMTLTQVAECTGLTRANARRVLLTLVELGYVEQDATLRLRPKILDLGHAYLSSASLARIAQPTMEELVRKVKLSTNLSVLEGTDIIYLARVAAHEPLDLGWTVSIGRRLPAHLSAIGRVLLGGLSGAQLSQYLAAAESIQIRPRSIVDPERMQQVIEADRRKGWSYVDQELGEYMYSMAVPIQDREQRIVAAISLGGLGPRTRREAEQDLLPALRAAADEISAFAAKSNFKPRSWEVDTNKSGARERPTPRSARKVDQTAGVAARRSKGADATT